MIKKLKILVAKFSLKQWEDLNNVGPEIWGSKNTRQLHVDMREVIEGYLSSCEHRDEESGGIIKWELLHHS